MEETKQGEEVKLPFHRYLNMGEEQMLTGRKYDKSLALLLHSPSPGNATLALGSAIPGPFGVFHATSYASEPFSLLLRVMAYLQRNHL